MKNFEMIQPHLSVYAHYRFYGYFQAVTTFLRIVMGLLFPLSTRLFLRQFFFFKFLLNISDSCTPSIIFATTLH